MYVVVGSDDISLYKLINPTPTPKSIDHPNTDSPRDGPAVEYEDVTDIQRRYSHVGGKAVNIKDFDLLKVGRAGWFCAFVWWVGSWGGGGACIGHVPARLHTHLPNGSTTTQPP